MVQTATRYPIRVGVQIHPQHTTYQSFADTVRRAEDMGVDSIWDWDHFFPLWGNAQGGHFEGWTLLTAMATLTTRVQIGCLVTCNSYRNPALLSNIAKTVDHISHGRLILGIGAGWCEYDYEQYGYEFGTTGSRLTDLEEALPIILHRWEVDIPKPIRYPIPILIGGGGEKRTLRLAGKYANMWHGFGDVATIVHKMQVLDRWSLEAGRNPYEIERSTTVNNEATSNEYNAYAQAGITHFVLDLETPWNFDALHRLICWRDTKRGDL